MLSVVLSESKVFTPADLVGLYGSVGWAAYTNDPHSLARAVDQSSYVVSARDSAGELLGLARAISDDVSICYLQDILVRPGQQQTGIGRAMVHRVLERYVHVRQKVLITDDEPGQRAFYESIGFVEAHDFAPAPLRAFVQIGQQHVTSA
ncbi:GNAT family acetyltransferase [Cryobacterium roopkundense]|uniref:GNAT family acetyltransferase n=1 Tax=Cryobacterium roopkundense TaxID=1001240 RepID=A0A099J5S0_9MICO|nr:GNAT family N-acetyltransferase [Cryobacterium roopkundense]KGJ72862.1 GNAT family acetyltransferase [Cryobacterium roopkundense]MBB5643148.1 GNAT superfamily N-acetyltransferase [Cryobacterium roopkundense]